MKTYTIYEMRCKNFTLTESADFTFDGLQIFGSLEYCKKIVEAKHNKKLFAIPVLYNVNGDLFEVAPGGDFIVIDAGMEGDVWVSYLKEVTAAQIKLAEERATELYKRNISFSNTDLYD